MSNNLCLVCCVKTRFTERLQSMLPQYQDHTHKTEECHTLQYRLLLLRKCCEETRKKLIQVQKEVHSLSRSNTRREDRLRRAREKDLGEKLKFANSECLKKRALLSGEITCLMEARKGLIETIVEKIFHMKTPSNTSNLISSTSANSIGTTAVPEPVLTDYDIIDGHCLVPDRQPVAMPTSLSYIGHGILPRSEELTDYLQHDKLIVAEEEDTRVETDHLSDRSRGVSAALALVVHCLVILSSILAQPLPHPLILPVALCEYGKGDKSLSELIRFLAKLDDNIVFLCFTQNIDPTALKVGDTISNLFTLVHCRDLGRMGPFECHPDLLRYPHLRLKKRSHSTEPNLDWDSEPPLLHSAQSPTQTCAGAEGSNQSTESSSEEAEFDSKIGEGWEELHDMIVPSSNYYGIGTVRERLEYGTSYSEYTVQQGLHDDQYEKGAARTDTHSSSTGLLDTLGSLLGSGWIKKP